MHRRVRTFAAGLIAILALPVAGEGQPTDAATGKTFFDTIHAPNWLGAEIEHTSVKQQRGGTCWSFSTVAFLESEVLRSNPALREALDEADEELDLSEYYVVYWAYVEKAREYARRGGEGARFTDGGLSHDVTWIVSRYGIVPESSYVVVDDYDLMRAELDAVLEARAASADWSEEAVVAEVRSVLDRHLAPPPQTISVDGRSMTPMEYAASYLGIDPAEYWELTSYTDLPPYGRGELDVPDNWWDYDGYYNLPLSEWTGTLNRALDGGYPVVLDTDWSDRGASWNGAGLAVVHPELLADRPIDQTSRQQELEDERTTDDHLVLAVDHRVLDGEDWYLIKNSHGEGSGRRGYVWMRGDWVAMRVLAYMVHRDAVAGETMSRFGADR